ncbi:MAG: hypothetical protein QOK48_3730 [Blastocatellia bacterium]|jgi:hypothetical protein|nr:hypothetical protein [Blastocatellia bacterium]
MSLEADLSVPISEQLIRLAYIPYAEVPFLNCASRVDPRERNGSDLIVVQPKRTVRAHANHQSAI